MKKNIITIKHEGYIAKIKYSIKKNQLSFDFIESNFYSQYSEKNRFPGYAGKHIFYLSRMQKKYSTIYEFSSKEIKSYIHCLQKGIPEKDIDGEWCIDIKYEK